HPTPHTPHPTPETPHPTPETLHPTPETITLPDFARIRNVTRIFLNSRIIHGQRYHHLTLLPGN
ncbi:hypothetical protein, partial [Microcystis aeruginosa]|uniref:hypothetical protein n=1 Tax=Microcystis aeruginosa TaxID=1126 RepID=UPI001C209F97